MGGRIDEWTDNEAFFFYLLSCTFSSTHLVKTDKSDLIATLMNYIINSNKNRTALTSNRFLSKTTGRISSGTVELMLLGMR